MASVPRLPKRSPRPLVGAAVIAAAVVALGAAGCRGDEAAIASDAPEAVVPDGRIGDIVEVGSLDLVIVSIGTFDGTDYNSLNQANFRLKVEATNKRGDPQSHYRIDGSFFTLITPDGETIVPAQCSGCPDKIERVDLARDETIEGYIYFEYPSGPQPELVHYSPAGSMNETVVALEFAGGS